MSYVLSLISYILYTYVLYKTIRKSSNDRTSCNTSRTAGLYWLVKKCEKLGRDEGPVSCHLCATSLKNGVNGMFMQKNFYSILSAAVEENRK